jgi:MSHA biogenesis protein MshO
MMINRQSKATGFSLVELLVVIVILGIGAALTIGYITYPVTAFTDMQRRARLTERADAALYQITRDVRLGLPNSIRISTSGSRTAIEVLQIRTAGRYRAAGAGDELDFTLDADSFDALGGIPGFSSINTGAAGINTCISGAADCLVIYNTGTTASANNAYVSDNVATITASSATSLSFDNSNGVPAFPLQSPSQRFYVVSSPISFVCDTASEQITRYTGYGLLPVQPVNSGDFGVGGNLLTDGVSSCAFSYIEGTNSRNGVITLQIGISEAGESISLLQQVHIYNSP